MLVEKPMALSVDDAQRMIDACDTAGVRLGVGFHLRAHEGHRRLRTLVADGALGRVSFAQASWCRGVRGQEAPPPREGLQAWWDDPSLIGAGAFMATGVHCADLLRYVLDDDVTEVSAVSDATPEKPLEELVTLALRFRSGAIATLLTGRRTPDYENNDVMVYGTLGRAGLRSSIEMTQGGALAVRTDALAEDETYPEHPFALYTKQVQAFDAAVEGNGEPLASGLDGLRVVEITLAMVESARTGRSGAVGVGMESHLRTCSQCGRYFPVTLWGMHGHNPEQMHCSDPACRERAVGYCAEAPLSARVGAAVRHAPHGAPPERA